MIVSRLQVYSHGSGTSVQNAIPRSCWAAQKISADIERRAVLLCDIWASCVNLWRDPRDDTKQSWTTFSLHFVARENCWHWPHSGKMSIRPDLHHLPRRRIEIPFDMVGERLPSCEGSKSGSPHYLGQWLIQQRVLLPYRRDDRLNCLMQMLELHSYLFLRAVPWTRMSLWISVLTSCV